MIKQRFQRLIYNLLWHPLLPLILARLYWKARRLPAYNKRLEERLAKQLPSALKPPVWIHAVSVGEAMVAIPVIKRLLAFNPHECIWVTTTTPTGSERIKQALGDQVIHTYAPYDHPGIVKRFLDHVNPRLLVLVETELWINWIHQCYQRGTPTLLINGRLSERSAQGYGRFKALTRAMLTKLTHIAVQSHADANRFVQLGAKPEQMKVMGSTKLEINPSDASFQLAQKYRTRWGRTRPVWIAASTHPGEEALMLKAHEQLLKQKPDCLLVLVPRHPDRFKSVAQSLMDSPFKWAAHSEAQQPLQTDVQVLLGDTMGEMFALYGACDVAVVCGSFTAIGGHNMLEPIAMGTPPVVGPYLFNFQSIADALAGAKGLIRLNSSESLAPEIARLLEDAKARETLVKHGRTYLETNRGALGRTVELIRSVSH